jgi:hypothetical protein
MKLIKSKKGLALLAVLAVAVIGAVAGYAYFTASGSGSGSGTVGTASSIQITGSEADALYPGESVTIPITVHNPGGGNQYVGTVSTAAVNGIVPSNAPSCDPAWFSMAAVPVTTDIPAGGDATVVGTIQMTDAPSSQNACFNNSLDLSFVSN